MSTLPTPIRAALGLAATALDEARKLPETLPQVPVVAVTTAMQASLRVQQHIAALAARGDELLSQLRGTTAEAPAWATFDEDEAPASSTGRSAAFDRVEHDSDSDPDELPDSTTDRFAASDVGGTEAAAEPAESTATVAEPVVTAAVPTSPKKTAAKKASATKASATKTTPSQATPTRTTSPKKTVKRSEPLADAAKHAKPSDTPNPSTMAAEIVHAHEAETQSEG